MYSNQPLDNAESPPAFCCETSPESRRRAAAIPPGSLPFASRASAQGSPASPTRARHRRTRAGIVGSPPGNASHAHSTSCPSMPRSEEHTSELQSHSDLVCRLLLEKKKQKYLL